MALEKLGPGDPHGIGAYRLLARLGAGGMGQVYLARSDRGRTVAVKLVRRELAEQEEFRNRFRLEVEAARRVGGKWTAPVLDADTEAAIPWVATGYVPGPALGTVVSQDHGALPERSVRILAAGLAHALKDIHAAGLIHRDLKPSNVLVTIDGPRVIDFGIARAMQTVTDGGLTRTGALVGSPGFMAPEQVRGDRITPACDVFCLGSVLAYAATGQLPFGAADSGVHALMFRIAQEEPDLDRLPENLTDLVRDCLRKDPAARPSLDDILQRTGAQDTVGDGRARDPWLPSTLVAQLGRHAVQLLETENPDGATAAGAGPAGAGHAEAGPAEAGPAGTSPAEAGRHGSAAAAARESGPAEAQGAAPAIPGQAAADRLPTQPSGSAPLPAPRPAGHDGAPGYGYPQGHSQPHPSAYGYPQPGGYGGATPPYGPGAAPSPYGPGGTAPTPLYGPGAASPYGPGSTPPPYGPAAGGPGGGYEPPPRSRRSTIALVAAALVVAVGAGGSVYAVMKGDGDPFAGADAKPSASSSGPADPGSRTPEASGTPDSGSSGSSGSSGTTGASPTADGAVPEKYLGSWTGSIDNAAGRGTRRLVIQQGEVGDTVLSLTADGPAEGGGTYHCVFRAELASAPSGDGSLRIGPSTVTAGEPASSCMPGAATTLTILPDGRLRRVNADTGEQLTYTKAG